MTRVIVVHGPPGTGKTRLIGDLFQKAVQSYGPSKVAAVTYTRAAAQELQQRAALRLGITAHSYKDLTLALPWVGTIHALCYRLLRHPLMVDRKNLQEFFGNEALPASARYSLSLDLPDPEDADGYAWGMSRDEQENFLIRLSYARHVRDPEAVSAPSRFRAFASRPDEDYAPLIQKYLDWKAARRLWDFEDLLEKAPEFLPEVRVLFIDEAQDNSPLMMQVTQSWARSTDLTVYAGDPFQAIYQFCGADPRLLTSLPRDKLVTLTTSHRLAPDSATYAHKILGAADWEPEQQDWLETWHGAGGQPRDGSEFFLARTRHLVSVIKQVLVSEGTPYKELRGKAPLDTLAGTAFKLLTDLGRGNLVPRAGLKVIARATSAGMLQPGVHAELLKLSGDFLIGREQAEKILREACAVTRMRLPYAPYFLSILTKHSMEGLFTTPLLKIGTVHASKGLEADRVRLLTSWGTLPHQMLSEPAGRRSEACVAYVGATRHRESLELIDYGAAPGRPYPWPE